MSAEDRFDKLEAKIDKLTDVVVDLARLEERHIEMQGSIKRVWEKIDDHDRRIRPLENKLAALGWMERIMYAIVLAAVIAFLS